LYERLAPTVYRVLWALLGPDSERDDVAHDVFVRILRAAGGVRDASKLEAWAARVTMNAVKNEFRRRKLRRFLSLDAKPEVAPGYHPDFEGREVLLHTYAVLGRMPTHQRLPFSLRLIQRSTAEEIAEVCGISVRTVKRRLRAGRERFLELAAADPLLAPRLAAWSPDSGEDDG
jgi:RNA polymerase sigma-70 factor (ECF subfamily)